MATRNPLKTPFIFSSDAHNSKTTPVTAIFLWLENNQHETVKLCATLQKILGSGFRATLIFQKVNVALNLLSRIFISICRKFNCDILVIFQQ